MCSHPRGKKVSLLLPWLALYRKNILEFSGNRSQVWLRGEAGMCEETEMPVHIPFLTLAVTLTNRIAMCSALLLCSYLPETAEWLQEGFKKYIFIFPGTNGTLLLV